ncbi:MaoC family dehydratase [Parahaliea mediterranea]|uniref:MaoC family dehydratase n=1 Tax=Parahaliea mediterranea TaxID=651086 RepID=UPI000E2FA47C|nr:MaoC family dehydratase [Parahaliea mediterranea]
MSQSTGQVAHGYYLHELAVGMQASYSKAITDEAVQAFATVSGDDNPLHLNDDFARETRFGRRLAHGMLTTSLWSTIVGTQLPGPGCAYMSQELVFLKPVYIGDTVVAGMTVTAIDTERQQVVLSAQARVGDVLVARGEGRVWVPRAQGK